MTNPCLTPEALHAWILHHTHLNIPRRAICANHQAPFDYVCTAYFEPSRDQIVWAPRGGGKTSLAALVTLLDLLHKPGCSVRILGGSLEQSLRMWEHLLPHFEKIGEELIANPRATARRLELTNGSAAAVLTQSQRSVRGVRVQKIRCDEVDLFEPAIWEAAQLATRSDNGFRGTIEALSTLHRPFGLMQKIVDESETAGRKLVRWCLLDVLERCPPQRDCNSCTLWTECGGVAKLRGEGFVRIDDAIAMKARVSADTWNSEMLCRRPSVRGLVFAMFDPQMHVRAEAPFVIDGTCEWWLAMDFGFSAPFVCLWIVRKSDAHGEMFYVVDEYLQKQCTLEQHLIQIDKRQWPRARRVACDPAGNGRSDQTATSNVELLRTSGYGVKTKSSLIVDGIELIRAALQSASGQTRLYVHPRCRELIKAMQSYRYKTELSELPDKDGTHDHPIDALRYFFVNQKSTSARPRVY